MHLVDRRQRLCLLGSREKDQARLHRTTITTTTSNYIDYRQKINSVACCNRRLCPGFNCLMQMFHTNVGTREFLLDVSFKVRLTKADFFRTL